MKIKTQDSYLINVSYLVMYSLDQTMQIFSNYSDFFAVQDLMVNVTSINQAPNHKVDHIFSHLIQVSTEVFDPGSNISSYNQYTSFQGHHANKQCIKFKHTGDVFLIDAVLGDGYTINFYMRNEPPPKKLIEKGYSTTHSQIIFMLDILPDKYYTCSMDNIFISVNFLWATYEETKSKTMVDEVFRQKGRGLTKFVVQEYYTKDRKNMIS